MGITMTLNAMHHESFVKRLYQYCNIIRDMPIAAPAGCGLSTYLEMSGVLPRVHPANGATLNGCLLLLSPGNYMRPIDECCPSVIIAAYDLGDSDLDGDFQATFNGIVPTQGLYRMSPASNRGHANDFKAIYSTWTSSVADIDAGQIHKYVLALIYRADMVAIARRLCTINTEDVMDMNVDGGDYVNGDVVGLAGELNVAAAPEKLIALCFHADECQRLIAQDIAPWSFQELVNYRDRANDLGCKVAVTRRDLASSASAGAPTAVALQPVGFQAFDATVNEFPDEYVVRNGEYKYIGSICVVMQMCAQIMRSHVLNSSTNKILTAMRYVDSVSSPGTATISVDIWFNRGSDSHVTIRDVIFTGHIFVVKLCGENIVSLHKDIKTPTNGIYSVSGRVKYAVSGRNNVIMHVYVANIPESDDDMSD